MGLPRASVELTRTEPLISSSGRARPLRPSLKWFSLNTAAVTASGKMETWIPLALKVGHWLNTCGAVPSGFMQRPESRSTSTNTKLECCVDRPRERRRYWDPSTGARERQRERKKILVVAKSAKRIWNGEQVTLDYVRSRSPFRNGNPKEISNDCNEFQTYCS